jgi:hypothetical protein
MTSCIKVNLRPLSKIKYTVTFTGGSDVTGFDAVRVGRGMPRAPVPFCGCGGTPHGRGSFCGAYGVRGSAVRARKRGIKTNRCRNKRGLYSDYVQKRGVGTWWRRNLSEAVSVTWRSAPGGCRRRAWLVLTVVPVGPGLGWLFYLSGRTWTLRALPAPVGGKGG